MAHNRLIASGSVLGCFGCLGVLGLGGLVTAAAAATMGFGLWSLQQDWELALHTILTDQTGGEVSFEDLRVGWGAVTLRGVVVRDTTGEPVLVAEALVARVDPYSLVGATNWELRRLEVDGLQFTPHRVEGDEPQPAFATPTRTLAWLRGERPDGQTARSLPTLGVARVVLSDPKLSLDGWTLHSERVELPAGLLVTSDPGVTTTVGAWEATGVHLAGTFETAIAAVRGQISTPVTADTTQLEISGFTAEGAEVQVGELVLAVAEMAAGDSIHLDWVAEPSLLLGPGLATGLELRGATPITVGRAEWALPQGLTLDSEQVSMPHLALFSVRSTVSDSGWTVLDHIFTSTAGRGLPRVHVGHLSAADVKVSVPDAAVRVGSARASLLAIPGEQVGWGEVSASDLRVTSGDQTLAAVESATAASGLFAADHSELTIGAVTVQQATATLRWGQPAFGLPTTLFRIGGTAEGLRIASVDVSGLHIEVDSATGTLPVRAGSARLDDVFVAPERWSISGASLREVVAEDDRKWASAAQVTLHPGGTVALGGAHFWTRVDARHQVDLPPVLRDHAPAWAGGAYTGGSSWFGVAFPGSPYRPKKLVASDLTLHLIDDGIASTHTAWTVPMDLTWGPHDADGRLPLEMSGTLADGRFDLDGSVRASGDLALHLNAYNLDLLQLGPYIDAPLDRFGMVVKRGRGGMNTDISLNGSQVALNGRSSASNLELGGSALAGVANTTFFVAKGGDGALQIPVKVEGDLADPEFSLMDAVFESFTRGLGSKNFKGLAGASGAVSDVVGAVTGTRTDADPTKTGTAVRAAERDLDKAVDGMGKALDRMFSTKPRSSRKTEVIDTGE